MAPRERPRCGHPMTAYELSARPRPGYELEGRPAICGLPLGHYMGNHLTEEAVAEDRRRRADKRRKAKAGSG